MLFLFPLPELYNAFVSGLHTNECIYPLNDEYE